MTADLQRQFATDGYFVVRELLTESESVFYTARLRAVSEGTRWTQPDGVNRNPEFWPLIFNERLVTAVRSLFGPDVRYLPHNDLHFGFSSFSWHRDSVNRGLDGPDWNESAEPYRIARVGIYLQRFEESHFRLGLVRGSHRRSDVGTPRQQRVRRRTGAVANVLSGLTGLDLVGEDADWIATQPGDCVIFDPRVLHTGSRFSGEKASIFVAYGIPNSHFRNHWHYYLHLRSDLGYSPMPSGLIAQLEAAGLLAEAPHRNLQIEGAWVPSSTYTYVAKRFK